MKLKIEEYGQFVKDTESKAIINVDKNALSMYKMQRQKAIRSVELENEVKQLKEDIGEIKSLLSQLINNK